MFDNYGYFARNLRYVINVMHCSLRYGASRLFITLYILPVYGKKIAPNSLTHHPLCNLIVVSSFGAEKNEEDIPLWSTAKEELLWWFSPVSSPSGGSPPPSTCKLLSPLISLSLLSLILQSPLGSFSALSPSRSLLALSPDLSLLSASREQERDRESERGEIWKEGDQRKIKGGEKAERYQE